MNTRDNRRESKKRALLAALKKHRGLIYKACKEANVSRWFFYNYYDKDENFRREVDEINEATKDFVEEKLFELIEKGNERCIIFYLQKKAADRGYGDSNKNNNNNISEIKIIHINNNEEK